MDTAIIIALCTTGGGVLGALINGWFGRKKTSADISALLSAAAMDMLKPYQETVESLRCEVRDLRTEVADLRSQIERKDESIAALKRDLVLRERRINELEARICELESEVHKLRAENAALKGGDQHA